MVEVLNPDITFLTSDVVCFHKNRPCEDSDSLP